MHFEPGGVSFATLASGPPPRFLRRLFEIHADVLLRMHPMLIDVATLVGVFAAGYGLRAWISTKRRHAMRKARGD